MELLDLCHQRVGTTLRRKYRLDALLGMGGMAAVFAATHRNGSRVALKVLHPHVAHDQDVRARFLREGYVANRIPHAGIVRIADDDDDDDGRTVFLVMELLEGVTLQRTLDVLGGKLPLDEAIRCTLAILDVLATAHDLGIVHRDIKPENIFICPGGHIKVLDFGIARVAELATATTAGNIMGTPAYMAPEQAAGRNREIDARTDIWAVGALLFRMLAGREVHESPNAMVQIVFAATQPAQPLLTTGAQVAPEVAAIVDRALQTDRAARWQTARELANALSAVRPRAPASASGTIIRGSG